MQKREPKYYGPLRELAWKRDLACHEAYKVHIGIDAPGRDYVLHHVRHRNGCPSMDREDNVISADPREHTEYIHGPKEYEIREKILEYLSCGEVEAWRQRNREEIEAVEALKEECRIRAVRKGCTVKKQCLSFRNGAKSAST